MSDKDKESGLWLAVKRDIEVKIITGEYPAGARIPTIVELSKQYNIGKTTAQKIITALNNEGIIIKRVSMGCFVKPFVKGKLLERHKEYLRENLENCIQSAKMLQLDKDYLLQLVNDEWENL